MLKACHKVVFKPFVGVGPQRFIDLFALSSGKWGNSKRKDSTGKRLDWDREHANLRNPMALLTYIDAEDSAAKDFEEETISLKGDDNDVGK